MKLVTAGEMRALEQQVMARGISLEDLIARAGHAVAEAAHKAARGGAVLILAGPGNNGADGIVAAQELLRRSHAVTVYTFRRRASNFAGPVVRAEDDNDLTQLQALARESAVVVDALLGTGTSRPPEGLLAEILDALEHIEPHGQSRIAVDIPTGVDADTGAASSNAFRAHVTVCMGFPKRGVAIFPGAEFAGKLEIADVGIPVEAAANISVSLSEPGKIANLLPGRRADSNKGSYGRLVVIAGSRDYVGAPAMAGIAAYRIGAGLVQIAPPSSIQPTIAAHLLEAIYLPLAETDGRISTKALDSIRSALSHASAAVIGPGMGLSTETISVIRATLAVLDQTSIKAAVIDADGLNALAQLPDWWRLKTPLVLTPHPGEMGRLVGSSVKEVQADRVSVALRSASRWGKIVVLKGAGTIVATPDGEASINPTGGPNLATAGTGDVLSGTIGGLLAQGCPAAAAARAGVYLHGLAADMYREKVGDAGMLASDLLTLLPRARAQVTQKK